jgi:hypothetical protein
VRLGDVRQEVSLPVQAQGLGDVREVRWLRPYGWPGHAGAERKGWRRAASSCRVAIQAYLTLGEYLMCLRTRRGERLEDVIAKLDYRLVDAEHMIKYQGEEIESLKRSWYNSQEAFSQTLTRLVNHLGIKEGFEKQ